MRAEVRGLGSSHGFTGALTSSLALRRCVAAGYHVREERRQKAAAEERQNRPRGPSRKQIKRMRRRIHEAKRNGHPAPDEEKLAEMERERAEARRRRSPTMGYGNFRRGSSLSECFT